MWQLRNRIKKFLVVFGLSWGWGVVEAIIITIIITLLLTNQLMHLVMREERVRTKTKSCQSLWLVLIPPQHHQ